MIKGEKLVLETDLTNSGTFTPIAGLVSNGLTFSTDLIDVSTRESNGYAEKIAGQKSASVSGNGVFYDETSLTAIQDRAHAGTIAKYRLTSESLSKSWEGDFLISSFEVNGEITGAIQFSISLDSTGSVGLV